MKAIQSCLVLMGLRFEQALLFGFDGVLAGKASVAELRYGVIAPFRKAECLIESVHRDKGDAICADFLGDLFGREARCDEFILFGRINAIEAGVSRGGGCYSEMNGSCARPSHHGDDFARCGAAHDTIIDEYDRFASDSRCISAMFEFNAILSSRVGRLDECSADIVISDDTEIEGYSGFFSETESGGDAGIGDGDDDIGGDVIFAVFLSEDSSDIFS